MITLTEIVEDTQDSYFILDEYEYWNEVYGERYSEYFSEMIHAGDPAPGSKESLDEAARMVVNLKRDLEKMYG